ncbi:MAG: GxxExxY protein [Verrucomicrobiota bacterium]
MSDFLQEIRRQQRGENSEECKLLFDQASAMTESVIGGAIEVHREMGPGLLESIYERCFLHELRHRGMSVVQQKKVQVNYKGMSFDQDLRCDLIVNDCLLIELKSVTKVLPIHKAQTISYLKLLNLPLALLINFNETKLVNGVSRLILPGFTPSSSAF